MASVRREQAYAGRRTGKAPSERPAFQPYRGKLAVRNDRGDRGNVGIIRSPVRASILPDGPVLLRCMSLLMALDDFRCSVQNSVGIGATSDIKGGLGGLKSGAYDPSLP